MKYMPAPNEATCQQVSYSIYHLTRPGGVDTTDTTQYAFGWVQDVNLQWWMEWEESIQLPIHPERSLETLSVLAAFVAAGQLSQASADSIAATTQANTGGFVTLGQITPPEWLAMMVDSITTE